MTHVVFEAKLRLFMMSSMYPCPGNWVTIGRAVVYYARTAQALNAGISFLSFAKSLLKWPSGQS